MDNKNENMIVTNLDSLKESLSEANEKWNQLYKELSWVERGWYRADENQKQFYSLAILTSNLLKMFGELVESIDKIEKSVSAKSPTFYEKIKNIVSGLFSSVFDNVMNKENRIKISNKTIGK